MALRDFLSLAQILVSALLTVLVVGSVVWGMRRGEGRREAEAAVIRGTDFRAP